MEVLFYPFKSIISIVTALVVTTVNQQSHKPIKSPASSAASTPKIPSSRFHKSVSKFVMLWMRTSSANQMAVTHYLWVKESTLKLNKEES